MGSPGSPEHERSAKPGRRPIFDTLKDYLVNLFLVVAASFAAWIFPVLVDRLQYQALYEEYFPIVLAVLSISIGISVANWLARRWRSRHLERETEAKRELLTMEVSFFERVERSFDEIMSERV